MKLRLFVDGASRGNPGPAGLGVVIQDARGHTVAEIGEFLGEATNNVAEYLALLRALVAARARRADDLEIFADSDLLVQQINGRYRVKSPHLRPLYQEAVGALRAFRRWQIAHLPREKNAAADALANQAIAAAVSSQEVELTALVIRDSGQWRASVPALPGCEAVAPSQSVALERVAEAAAERLVALRASGDPLPREHRLRITLPGESA